MNFPTHLVDKVESAFNLQSHPTDAFHSRTSLHDRLVDDVYTGIEKLKEGIHKTVYNDKTLDLPELSFTNAFAQPTTQTRPMAEASSTASEGHLVQVSNRLTPEIYNNPSRSIYDSPSLQVKETQARPIPSQIERGIDQHFEITSDGRERDYLLHVPPSYDGSKPMPLVVVLHGLSQDAADIADRTNMSAKADKEGFIVVYPNATKWLGIQSLRAWDVDNGVQIPGTDSNDVGFVRDLVGTIKGSLNVDDNRVYAAGFSNGGMLTYRLASEMSDTFSAVAVVSGGASGHEAKPSRDVSLMAIHGTSDHVVPIRGLASGTALVALGLPHFESLRNSLNKWRGNAGIEVKPVIEKPSEEVFMSRAVNPRTGVEIVAYAIKGGGHEWPGSNKAIQKDARSAEATFPATDKIWDFFKSHSKTQKRTQERIINQTLLTA